MQGPTLPQSEIDKVIKPKDGGAPIPVRRIEHNTTVTTPEPGESASVAARRVHGNRYGYIRHETPGSRAAQRRLRQPIDPDVRCSGCRKWRKRSAAMQVGARMLCADCR